jgi:hypothetical protein
LLFLEKRRISAFVQTAVGGIVHHPSLSLQRKECGDTGFFYKERDWGQDPDPSQAIS